MALLCGTKSKVTVPEIVTGLLNVPLELLELLELDELEELLLELLEELLELDELLEGEGF